MKLTKDSIEEAQNWIAETEDWIQKKQNEVVNTAFSAEMTTEDKRVKIELISNEVMKTKGGLHLLKTLMRNTL